MFGIPCESSAHNISSMKCPYSNMSLPCLKCSSNITHNDMFYKFSYFHFNIFVGLFYHCLLVFVSFNMFDVKHFKIK